MTIFLELILIIGLLTGLLDMAGNGGANAGWAPYGLGVAVVSGAILHFGYGWN